MWMMFIAQGTSIPHMDLIQPEAKELVTYYCGCHGNIVTIATRYVADAYCPKEHPYQIWTQYDLRQRSYKAKCIRLRLRLADSRLTLSSSNYHQAVELLQNRFSIRQVINTMHMDNLLKIQAVKSSQQLDI